MFKKSPGWTTITHQMTLLQRQLSMITMSEMEIMMNYAKQRTFESANKQGKWLHISCKKKKKRKSY